jgi:hypothetical protein
MTASPANDPGAIAVVPASIGSTGDAVLVLAEEIRSQPLRHLSAEVIGSVHCSDALAGAAGLVEQALHASAQSLEEIARALRAASAAYGLADLVALPQRAR